MGKFSSFLLCNACPGRQQIPARHYGQIPECIQNKDACSLANPADKAELVAFVKGVNKTMKPFLEREQKAREFMEKRTCDYQIALWKGIASLANAYGPFGPRAPGGSYVFEVARYSDALRDLKMACDRDAGGCQALMDYERNTDFSLPVKFDVYEELKHGCKVGKLHSAVPNDSEAWCDKDTKQCEIKSCRQWWQRRGFKSDWEDSNRPEYDALKDVCRWTAREHEESIAMTKLWNQPHQLAKVEKMQARMCAPAEVAAPCQMESNAKRAKCNLKNGEFCNKGRVFPESVTNEMHDWVPLETTQSSIVPVNRFF